MIIFNISAGFCGFVIWVLFEMLKHFFPYLSPLMEALAGSALTILVGAGAELLDLRPKVFCLHLWVIGILLALQQTYLKAGPQYFWPAFVVCSASGLFYWYLRRRMSKVSS
jgi:hypothetical protein